VRWYRRRAILIVYSPNNELQWTNCQPVWGVRAVCQGRADDLTVLAEPVTFDYRAWCVDLAAQSRLPTIYWNRVLTEAGSLMAYGPSLRDQYRRAAYFVDKILKGAKPAELPVERPIKFELIINLKTAQALGLTIPSVLLFRADEVIR
jgi:putative tryptophan/tyrosine transport system substrate-binding protein